jgi:molybdate transport system substrate-binding protein
MRSLATAIAAVAFVAHSLDLHAADLRVMSGGGAQAVLQTLAPRFEGATGNKLEIRFAVVSAIQEALMKGEKADVVVLPVPLLDALEKSGAFRAQARTVVGRIPIGVVVREGEAGPDISQPEAVRRALLNSHSVVFPDPGATPTGKHVMSLFARMGIDEAMRPKTTFRNAIDGGVGLVRDGKLELGLFLVTEVLPVKGVTLVGKLPDSLQGYVVYAATVAADSKAPKEAMDLVKFLSEPEAASKWRAAGFETGGD